jgi:hypothetical protein
MPSRRSRIEAGCRVGAFALLGWLVGTSLFPSIGRRIERAEVAGIETRLPAWTRAAPNVGLYANLAATPDAWVVDWLAALRHSGHSVSWSGRPPAVAMSIEALPDPDGGNRIDVAAPESSLVVIRDDVSLIDSIRITRLGGSVVAPVLVGPASGSVGQQPFGVAGPGAAAMRAIVIIGQAGWEGKFIASALEERGWPVIARFSVAPNVYVTQASAPLVLDTSRIAAVVAVDTSIARLGDVVARFVRSGGGLVLAGSSGSAASIAALAPGAVAERFRPGKLPGDTIGLGSTGFYPVSRMKDDGVALERRTGGVSIAARRVGAGRVVQVGYDDSWRWRMAGAPGSEAAHRAWWSRVVGSVAYVPSGTTDSTRNDDSAPLARMVDRLGPARSTAPSAAGRDPIDPRILITLIMLLLLTEWASRRMRGLR